MRAVIALLLVAAAVGTYAAEKPKDPEKPKAVIGALSESRQFARLPKRTLLADVKQPAQPKAVAAVFSESRQFERILPKRALLADVKEPEKPKAVAGALSESRQFERVDKP